MTFWDWWENNRQKTWGQIIIAASVIGLALQAGGANAFLSTKAVAVLSFICVVITGIAGGGTTKSAFNNTTRERVAESMATVATEKAKTAQAMETAILTPSPIHQPINPGE